MLKEFRLIFVYALAALFSGAFAQSVELDVIYRDFPVEADGFEEFMACDGSSNSISTPMRFKGDNYVTSNDGTELKYGECQNGGKRGYCNGPDATSCDPNANGRPASNCSNGSEGWMWMQPIKVTLGMVGQELYYDKDNCREEDLQEDLDNPNNPRDFMKYRYCARPSEGNDKCSSLKNPGNKIAKWFSSGGDAKELRDIITLNEQSDGTFLIEYNANTTNKWNVDGSDNGFFPLDKYDDDGSGKTWGRQSLNVWCGKDDGTTGTNYNKNDDGKGVCPAWGQNGGVKSPTAARKTAESKSIKNKLHNYGFSAAGSGAFKYNEANNDRFEFIGDDDMWIYLDGQLVADLGGVHLAAPAKILINEYAKKTGPWSDRPGDVWQPNSMHAINFFYMDRNTDGSNFKLKVSLYGLSASRFGAPRIIKAETTIKADGTSETVIYVNNTLENLGDFTTNGEFPILIKKSGSNDLLAFRLDEVVKGPVSMGSQGYAYTIRGEVCKSKNECGGNLILNSGDSLSFNVKNGQDVTDGGFQNTGNLGLPENLYILSSSKTPATTKSWAINTTNLPPIDFKPSVPDQTPVKPPFVIADGGGSMGDQGDNSVPGGAGGSVGSYDGGGKFPNITQVWDPTANGGAGGMTNISNIPGAGVGNNDVHGFGTVGKQIPPQRAGELILTVYPSTKDGYTEWLKDEEMQKYFGLPPEADGDNWWGLANPKTEATYDGKTIRGYQFVKNGFPNESSTKGYIKIAPTRCTTRPGIDGEPRINCLNFNLKAQQPFQLAVTVYDQLGNFVTQYRETLTEQEFRNVVQAPNYIDDGALVNKSGASSGCEIPTANNYGAPTTLTTNGQINVSVNIYPFSADGRRFGNGVYIVKVDRVDLPFKDGEKNPETGNGYTCASAGGGNSARISPNFIRYHADQKFGWMRTKEL